MTREDEHRFIERILSGEKNVFRYFIQEYQQMSYSISMTILNNHTEAQDAVQNAFIYAYKGIRSFRKESKFSSWLYKIVVNESLKQLKKSKRQSQYIEYENYVSTNESRFESQVDVLETEERKKAIDRVLQLLKPKEALVLSLHYLHEQSLKEIEEITGFSLSNVKVLLYRARKSFMGKYLELNIERI